MAGEQVVYSIKVHEVITDDRKKIEAILSSNALTGEISQGQGNTLIVTIKGAIAKKLVAATRVIETVVPGTQIKTA